jgi:hypothetical protein
MNKHDDFRSGSGTGHALADRIIAGRDRARSMDAQPPPASTDRLVRAGGPGTGTGPEAVGAFLALWLERHGARLRAPDEINGLAVKLLSDAYQQGVPIRPLLAAVRGDPFSFLRRVHRGRREAEASRLVRLRHRLAVLLPERSPFRVRS